MPAQGLKGSDPLKSPIILVQVVVDGVVPDPHTVFSRNSPLPYIKKWEQPPASAKDCSHFYVKVYERRQATLP